MFDQLRIGDKALAPQKFTPDHPDPDIGDGHGFHLMLYGKYSSVYRDVIGDTIRKREGKKRQTIDDLTTSSIDLVVGCCAGWGGYEEEGKPVKYSDDKLRERLEDDVFRWIRLQAEQFILSDDNFF